MKPLALALAFCLLSVGLAPAVVVRPAPDIQWLDANGVRQNLSKFRGQPVLLIIASSPKAWIFRAQVGQLQRMYQRFAADKLVCIVAFTAEPGLIRSNIPFAIAADGPRVGYDYQANDRFAFAIIGRDGNLDYVTDKVIPAERIYDLMDASYANQEALRRQ